MTAVAKRTRTISALEIASIVEPGMRIYLQGFTGEPTPVLDALQAAPEASRNVTYSGVWIPGVNRRSPLDWHPSTRVEAFFRCPGFSSGIQQGRIDYRHMHYSQVYDYLAKGPRFDLAIVQTAAPDENGNLSSGICTDFASAVRGNADRLLAHVNANMPATRGAPPLSIDALDYVLEQEADILEMPESDPSPETIELARNVADLIDDGDTLQFGVGKIPTAILGLLKQKRNLRIHSGMISDPLLSLLDAGAIADEPGAVTTGAAAGTKTLYRRIEHDERFRFVDVSQTHGYQAISRIDNLVAINSALEVDLLGQAAADMADGRQISGTGGLVDFLRGCRASPGGRPILAFEATAKNGTVSRIVPRIAPGNAITVSRADIGIVVTEYGIADLRAKSVDERADALIAIAAPRFRDALEADWRSMRANF